MALSDKQIKLRLRTLRDLILKHRVLSVLCGIIFLIVLRILFRKKATDTGLDTTEWLIKPYIACDVSFIGYGQTFAVLRYAHIDVKTKTFSIPCVGYKPYYRFNEGSKENILNAWMKNMTLYEYSYSEPVMTTTLAIFRKEPHNLFRSMCDWYNLYLVCKLLNFDPKQVSILFMDDRPPSLLEDLWYILFGKISRLQFIPIENSYKTLVWSISGYESPLNSQNLPSLPYLGDFQDFILHSFNIHPSSAYDYKRLNITIIYRRNFMSHPERESALVYRKFHNDSELTAEVQRAFPSHNVRGLFLEYFSVKEQLKVIAGTDILVGMHGAGMTHILFLPSHSGCFEIFPKYTDFHDKYRALAKWRNIHYLRWKNADPRNEFPGFKTKIPSGVLIEHLNILYRKLCGTKQQSADYPTY